MRKKSSYYTFKQRTHLCEMINEKLLKIYGEKWRRLLSLLRCFSLSKVLYVNVFWMTFEPFQIELRWIGCFFGIKSKVFFLSYAVQKKSPPQNLRALIYHQAHREGRFLASKFHWDTSKSMIVGSTESMGRK